MPSRPELRAELKEQHQLDKHLHRLFKNVYNTGFRVFEGLAVVFDEGETATFDSVLLYVREEDIKGEEMNVVLQQHSDTAQFRLTRDNKKAAIWLTDEENKLIGLRPTDYFESERVWRVIHSIASQE